MERQCTLPTKKGLWASAVAAALAGFVFSASAAAAPQTTETAKLIVARTVDDIVGFQRFGNAVCATEDAAWVGEPVDKVVISAEGSVFGFQRAPDGWELLHELAAVKPIKTMQFGHSLSFRDGLGFVGSPTDSENGAHSGAIHLLERAGNDWRETAKIKAPETDRFDRFGQRHALDGDRLLVGAHGDDDAGPDLGAAYLYHWTASGGWQLEQKLLSPHMPYTSGFGVSLDLDGEVAVVGTGGSDRAFVYERTPNGWIRTALLEDPTPQAWDAFSWDVAVDGDVIAVGEPVVDNDTSRSGSVFIFERTGPAPGNWTLVQELKASNKASYDQFGYAVDLHEGRLLVGARWGRFQQKKQGAAYLFDRGPGGWQETAMFVPSGPDQTQFGTSVSLSASFALVGAPFAEGSVPGVLSGAAYVYELPLGEPTCDGVANSTGVPGTIRAHGSLAAGAGALDLWAEDLPAHQFGLFLIASSGGFVANPGGSQGNLCLGGSIGRFNGSLQSSSTDGVLHHAVDFAALPLPPPAEILPGETWHFQAWYRDGPTSNLTGAQAITFR